MWGDLVIGDNHDIARRFYNYPAGDPFLVSNNPVFDLPIYTITLSNSTTVTYEWLRSGFFTSIDGTLKIYKCLIDGTRVLVESTPIVNGNAVGNLNLVFTQYSYEVIIGNITYTDSSFNTCHAESTTDPTYFVDIDQINIVPAVGLFMVDCGLTLVDNDTVRLDWNDNIESGTVIQGCLRQYRNDIYNRTLISTNCSVGEVNTLTVNYVLDGPNYYISGELTQDGNIGFCRGDVVIGELDKDTSSRFALSGIFSIFILIISFALFFSDRGDKMAMGGAAGLVIAWITGLFAFPWTVVTTYVAFAAIIMYVGRYSKQK